MALSAVIVLYLDTFHAVAKYGSNTIVNAETSEVIDFFIEHFSNVMNSNGLGLYAFLKVFDYLLESGLEMSSITTDRHKSIRKHLKENCRNIIHQFDV